MPTYEYQCEVCRYQVDYFQSMKEPAKTVCPRCQGKLNRMVTKGAGLIFKGSGFYETDYKRRDSGTGRNNGNGRHVTKKESPSEEKKSPATVDKTAKTKKKETETIRSEK